MTGVVIACRSAQRDSAAGAVVSRARYEVEPQHRTASEYLVVMLIGSAFAGGVLATLRRFVL